MKLSKVTLGLGAYILISASFMLQVRNLLFATLGDFAVITSFRLFFISIFIFTVLFAFKIRLNLFKVGAIFCLFVLGYLLSMWQPYFSEKTHVFTYGLFKAFYRLCWAAPYYSSVTSRLRWPTG